MSLPNIKKRTLGTYPGFNVIVSITLTLTVLGTLGYLSIYGLKLIDSVKEDLQLTVYIKKTASKKKIEELKNQILQMPYIVNRKDAVKYTTKDEVANNYFIDTGDDFQNILDNNPFRDYLTISINKNYFDTEKLEKLKSELLAQEIVFEIQYPKNIIKLVHENIKKISAIALIFLFLLLFVNYLQISGAIKLALYSQRFLIRSMQLVGATSNFIKFPFILRSFIHGFLSGILASTLLFFLNHFLSTKLYQEASHYDILEEVILLSLGLTLFGTFIAILSANFAIKKYLNISLNQLY